jgi:hypothetical protein
MSGVTTHIKRLTQALAEAREIISNLLPMAEQARTQVSHDGSCGPWESCDSECMAAYYDTKNIGRAEDFLRDNTGEGFVTVVIGDEVQYHDEEETAADPYIQLALQAEQLETLRKRLDVIQVRPIVLPSKAINTCINCDSVIQTNE